MYYHTIFGWIVPVEIFNHIVNRNDNCSFLEIGSFQGKSACCMLELIRANKKNIHLVCVDLWPNKADLQSLADIGAGQGEEGKIIQELDGEIQDVFTRNIEGAGFKVGEHFTMHRGNSLNILKNFADKTFNFTYVDDNHSYEHLIAELPEANRVTIDGGIVAGDDWGQPGVIKAVREYYGENFEVHGPTWIAYKK